jgi:hypothetical protein
MPRLCNLLFEVVEDHGDDATGSSSFFVEASYLEICKLTFFIIMSSNPSSILLTSLVSVAACPSTHHRQRENKGPADGSGHYGFGD